MGHSIGTRCYEILEGHRGHFDRFRAAAMEGTDPEGVHQMRVNARRLRAAMRAFSAILPQSVLELEPELRWIASSLGAVRDLDVQIQHAQYLADPLGALKAAKLEEARADLGSRRFLDLAEALRCRIGVRDFAAPCLASTPVLMAAPDIVRNAMRSVRKAGSIDGNSAPEDIHTLRKRAKRLRYTIDCFANLYGKPSRRFIGVLKELQELLGAYQDATVAGELAGQLHGLCDDELLDRYLAEASEEADQRLSKLPDALDDLFDAWKPLRRRMERERRSLWKS